jgi:anti-sigma factor RsiW
MARVFQLDTDEHRAVQALLPWYVNATLDDDELRCVQDHLAQCERCQADAAWQARVRTAGPAIGEADVPADVDRAWAALSRRLGEAAPSPSRRRPPSWRRWLAARWIPLALGLQGALVALAAVWLVVAPRDEPFHTLGAGAPAAANVLVVFRPAASEAEVRRALREHRAQIVGGPTVTDAYLLRVVPLTAATLARLRADASVQRVESLEGDVR